MRTSECWKSKQSGTTKGNIYCSINFFAKFYFFISLESELDIDAIILLQQIFIKRKSYSTFSVKYFKLF